MSTPQPQTAASTGSVVAVCVTHEVRPDAGRVGSTGIDKRPSSAPVAVRALGADGDVVRDTANHGGPDKALYAYGQGAASTWEARVGAPLPPGTFGENLRLDGVDVDAALIGERWQLGAPGVGPLVEVTQPRIPCQTFARFVHHRVGESDATARWVRQFTAVGLPGAYLRVVRDGVVSAGDEVAVVSVPGHGVSVAGWFTGGSGGGGTGDGDARDGDAGEGGATGRARRLLEAEAAGQLRLADALRASAEAVLARTAG